MTLDIHKANRKILFFFGAGASVPAEVKDVRGLSDDYSKWLKANSKAEEFERIGQIKAILERWLLECQEDRAVDIELILETIEKLENAQKDVLTKFFEKEHSLLSEFRGNTNHSKDLKLFIRSKCYVPETKVKYLKPIIEFIESYDTLDIFSTNYDNSIEQFCDINDIRFTDGFDSVGWNPIVFGELKKGIRIYKIHGSIMWWRTEEGDYKSIPIKDSREEIMLSSGRSAVPLIVYPGKKLEYSEPLFDILSELKDRLKTTNYIFVVGYAFKDDHIARLFRYAAKKSRKMILFLISPSAFKIYEKELKYYRDEAFQKSLDSNFDSQSFNSPIPSKFETEKRAICLPYKIEKVLQLLKNRFLENLLEAERLNKQFKTKPEEHIRRDMLSHYVNCEYMDKADQIIEEDLGWDEMKRKDWMWLFSISLKGMLNRLPSKDEDSKTNWNDCLTQVMRMLQFDRFSFIPTLGMQTVTLPPHIELRIGEVGAGLSSRQLVVFLRESIIPILEDKLKLLEDDLIIERIGRFRESLRALTTYLDLWSDDIMTFEAYFNLRGRRYDEAVQRLRVSTRIFATTQQNEEGQARVRETIEEIERNEIQSIYKSASLTL